MDTFTTYGEINLRDLDTTSIVLSDAVADMHTKGTSCRNARSTDNFP